MYSSDSSDDEVVVVVRREKVFKDRVDYVFMENSYEFNERFRLTSVKMEELVNRLGPALTRHTNRSQPMSVVLNLQTALHFLGTGSQYHAVSDMSGISKASVCRAVRDVVGAVNELLFAEFVQWPRDMNRVVRNFFDIAGFPMVCGVVDGTLINISAPSDHEEVFVDRHGNHSINCMVVCGPDLSFFYSYANWPGSTHDARVLRNSLLSNRMDAGWRPIPDGVILADSGYPLKEWLIPPVVRHANDRGNARFLRSHRITRRIVENSLGVLKQKFPCLRSLRVSPEFACQIFNCCVALCNFSRNPGDEEGVEADGEDEMEGDYYEPDPRGEDRLDRIIQYFR